MPIDLSAPILITGGTGFAGSHLLEGLFSEGYTNVHVTSFSETPDHVSQILSTDNIHKLDLTNTESTASLIKKLQPQAIYHLAAFAFVGKSFEYSTAVFQNNITLQETLLKAVLLHAPQSRILTVGSAEEYGLSEDHELPMAENHPFRPVNPYAVSKVTQDLLAYAYSVSYDLDIVRVRPFNHIGERQTDDFVISSFAKQIALIERGQQSQLHVGNLNAVRDFSDVKDIAKGYITVMNHGLTKEVYNLGNGTGATIQSVLNQLIELSSTSINVVEDSSRLRPADIPTMIADITKVTALGWQPTIPLADSLQRVLEYWRNTL